MILFKLQRLGTIMKPEPGFNLDIAGETRMASERGVRVTATAEATAEGAVSPASAGKAPRKDVELDELKKQLAAMQAQLAKLSKDG